MHQTKMTVHTCGERTEGARTAAKQLQSDRHAGVLCKHQQTCACMSAPEMRTVQYWCCPQRVCADSAQLTSLSWHVKPACVTSARLACAAVVADTVVLVHNTCTAGLA